MQSRPQLLVPSHHLHVQLEMDVGLPCHVTWKVLHNEYCINCVSSLYLNAREFSDMTEERDINQFDCANESLHEQVKTTKQKGRGIEHI